MLILRECKSSPVSAGHRAAPPAPGCWRYGVRAWVPGPPVSAALSACRRATIRTTARRKEGGSATSPIVRSRRKSRPVYSYKLGVGHLSRG